jgi:hypothetical protein
MNYVHIKPMNNISVINKQKQLKCNIGNVSRLMFAFEKDSSLLLDSVSYSEETANSFFFFLQNYALSVFTDLSTNVLIYIVTLHSYVRKKTPI